MGTALRLRRGVAISALAGLSGMSLGCEFVTEAALREFRTTFTEGVFTGLGAVFDGFVSGAIDAVNFEDPAATGDTTGDTLGGEVTP